MRLIVCYVRSLSLATHVVNREIVTKERLLIWRK
nr:MAG TPA: hypothetical protein [Caudoviricetes sp.]DAX45633.1 MAG TPA: hypothetical protein [Caudoviricetes sp.]DAY33004.1 MAG TPA: hypothetical protein [Caudoviricetes sp.]